MSLTTLDYVEAPYYVTPSYGDIDQDPNQTELCTSVDEDDAIEVIDQTTELQSRLEAIETLSQNLKALQSSKDSVDDDQDDPPVQTIRTTFNVVEKISEVNRGTYQTKCLDRPKHESPQGASEFAKEEIELVIQNNYQKNRDGTIEMINKLHLKRQKKVLGYLIKQFGSNIFAGKTVAGLSLPVTIFEPRSHLERTAAGLTFAPYFLRQGGNTTNTLEQFKFAVGHFVSSLHLLINPQKPFNPLLGETFEGVIDGCHIYMEQVSHHPPVSAYQMIGENFKVEGVTESTAAMAANSIKSRKMGFPTVKYNNTKATIRALHPSGLMQGTTFGRRTFQFTDKFYVFDIENRHYCEIEFEPTGSSVLKKKKNSKDSFTGSIWKINGRFAQMLKQNIEKSKDLNVKFKEKEHAENKLETLEGCWLEHLKIGRDTVWSFGNPWPYKLQYIDNPLPSDSNYRLDVLYLRAEDEIKSQDHKVIYEEIQRKDRRLREQAKNKMKK